MRLSRSLVGWLLALVAFVPSSVVVLPTIGSTFQSAPQLFLTEFPYIPLLVGVLVLLWGLRKPRMPQAIISGILAVFFSTQPLLQASNTIAAMESAMQVGLGADYPGAIPSEMQTRMAASHWSLPNTFGARNLTARARTTVDVTYITPPERDLRLDVYQPEVAPAVGTLYPAIVVVHGGSWQYLDKGGYFEPHNRYLASQGYVVFDIQYRFSTEAVFPAQLEDVQCAVAWVRANAEQYQVDPSRIALLGRSAGGHLALLAAYRVGDPDLDLSCIPDGDPSVRAVIGIYPPTDLRLYDVSLPNGAISTLLGGTNLELPLQYAAASPTTWARDGLPATLLIIGGMDNVVPTTHGELLNNLLQATNTPVVLLRVPWARHGYDALMSSLGSQVVQPFMDRFLAWSLYHE
jgi:acetyl esterase/lipase